MATKTYARIQGSAVAELLIIDASLDIAQMFHNDLVWVDVTSVSPAPQQGWLYTAPSTFAAPPPPTLSPQQQYAQFIAAGVVITSNGTPSLNGTYPLDQTTLDDISAMIGSIADGEGFMGLPSVSFVDNAGVTHTFNAPGDYPLFTNWAKAVGQYVAGGKDVLRRLLAGQNAPFPTAPAALP